MPDTPDITAEQVIADTMRPYNGPTAPGGVDRSTLHGKVLCGYQGWFTAEGDGAGRGWHHWRGRDRTFRPGNCSIDLWPDMSEYPEDERYPTPFRHADGRQAHVFSSFNRGTVLRHFEWMERYGIDGAFVQRFAVEVREPLGLRHFNTVLGSCREGANRHGRTYAVMYDLSGLGAGQVEEAATDWKRLIDRMRITKDNAYLRHNGKPVVAVWGLGFDDGRKYTLSEGLKLIEFLKNDRRYGGCTVMLGVPTGWRTLDRDCVSDPAMHELVLKADVVSPWTVGRYRTPEEGSRHGREFWEPDIRWCREHDKEYLPVVFPGFSWNNLKPGAKLDDIPRLKGRFLQEQFAAAKRAGATMVYQAMFDEVDEATAIFKCTNDPPVGASRFLTYEGLPSDHYLRLTGDAARLFRENKPVTDTPPKR
jgi:hypothetical protein